jgi:hypothetical protein
MVLHGVRNIGIVRELTLLHLGQELSVVSLAGIWTQIPFEGIVVVKRSVHLI